MIIILWVIWVIVTVLYIGAIIVNYFKDNTGKFKKNKLTTRAIRKDILEFLKIGDIDEGDKKELEKKLEGMDEKDKEGLEKIRKELEDIERKEEETKERLEKIRKELENIPKDVYKDPKEKFDPEKNHEKEYKMRGKEHFIYSYNIILKIQEIYSFQRYLEYVCTCKELEEKNSDNRIEGTVFTTVVPLSISIVGIVSDELPSWMVSACILIGFIVCVVLLINRTISDNKKTRNDAFYLSAVKQVLRNNR